MRELMTFQKLRQIHKNNIELERLSNRYRELKYDFGVSGKEISDMPTAGRVFDTSMSQREEACDAEIEYRNLYYETEILIRKARRYIEQFPDVQLKAVLTLHFINGMPIYDVAPALGLSEWECGRMIKVHFNNVF